MSLLTQKEPALKTVSEDFLPLNGTDYVELYVSNSKQAAHFYKTAFGFQSYAYKGLESGEKDIESYVVIQDKIRLVLTSPCIAIQLLANISTNMAMVSK
jgi:4-hydroxyphenylpyruvate dioxygenase